MDFNKIYQNDKHPWGDKVKPVVTSNLETFKKGTVLDLGCGEGKEVIFLASEGFDVTGVDISSEALNLLTETANATEFKDNISTSNTNVLTYLSETNQNWDNIISFMTLHFLKEQQARETYQLIQNRTEKGGINIISDFTIEGGLNHNDGGFWLKRGELLEIYKDWELISYNERVSPTRAGPTNIVVTIVAMKSSTN